MMNLYRPMMLPMEVYLINKTVEHCNVVSCRRALHGERKNKKQVNQSTLPAALS